MFRIFELRVYTTHFQKVVGTVTTLFIAAGAQSAGAPDRRWKCRSPASVQVPVHSQESWRPARRAGSKAGAGLSRETGGPPPWAVPSLRGGCAGPEGGPPGFELAASTPSRGDQE